MPTFTLRDETFTSDLTDAVAVEFCLRSTSPFARDIGRRADATGAFRGNQRAWAHKLALEQRDREARAAGADATPGPPAGGIALGDPAALFGLFAAVAPRLKFPKLRLHAAPGVPVAVAPAGPGSRWAGCLFVSNGRCRELNTYYGRIAPDGTFVPSRDVRDGLVPLLTALVADPKALLAEQGRAAGCCCYCERPLDDERSTAVGYGATCAKHWGLPWGEAGRAERKARTRRDGALAREAAEAFEARLEEKAEFAREEAEAERRAFLNDPDYRRAMLAGTGRGDGWDEERADMTEAAGRPAAPASRAGYERAR